MCLFKILTHSTCREYIYVGVFEHFDRVMLKSQLLQILLNNSYKLIFSTLKLKRRK